MISTDQKLWHLPRASSRGDVLDRGTSAVMDEDALVEADLQPSAGDTPPTTPALTPHGKGHELGGR